jgi:hypothetical protein
MQPHGKPIVLLPGEEETIDLGNFEMSVKATGAETRGLLSLLEAAEPPNFGRRCTSTMTASRRSPCSRASTGSSSRAPSIVAPHLYVPAEMIGYFQDLSAAMAKGNADPPTLDDIARRHGMEVVGPVPKGYL